MRKRGSRSARLLAFFLPASFVLLSSAAGVAAVSAAPTANTGPVTAVGTTSATAAGTVNPNGQSTTWYFEYGTSASYGKKTSSRSAGSGTADVQVSGALTGLAAGTTYHYRLVATNNSGTTRGTDGMFTTLSPPRAVTGSTTAHHAFLCDARRDGRPERPGDDLVLRVRDEHELRGEDVHEECGIGHGGHERLRGAVRPGRGPALSLPARRHERRRHEPGRGPDVLHLGAAGCNDGHCHVDHAEIGEARGQGHPQRTGNDLVLRVRDEHELRRDDTRRQRRQGSHAPERVVRSDAACGRRPPTTTAWSRKTPAGTSRGADLTLSTPGVALSAQARSVVYGRPVMLTGVVPTGRRGESLTVFAAAFGRSTRSAVATVLTTDGGVWRYLARPRIRTSYSVAWQGATSGAITIGVRPRVTFRRIGRARFTVRVLGRRSFAGRLVRLQRLTATGRWVTVKRVRLKGRSAASFRVNLRRGRSRLRVVMSVNQAGPGYLAGLSRTIVYRRG